MSDCPNCEAIGFPMERGYDSDRGEPWVGCTTCWGHWYRSNVDNELWDEWVK